MSSKIDRAIEAVLQSIDPKIENAEIRLTVLEALNKNKPMAAKSAGSGWVCSRCGTSLDDFEAFCPCCGQHISWINTPP